MGLEKFTGNLLTQEEKAYRLKELYEYNVGNDLDMEFLPYLKRINAFPFMCTTQCCDGGKEGQDDAHFDFRCAYPPEWVVDNLLKPIVEKFEGIHVSLYGLHADRLRYCIWIRNEEYGYDWWEPVEYFISQLEEQEE